MVNASALPSRYRIGKTSFYQRRNYLLSLGYNLEPKKDGNQRKYSDSQVQLLDELDKYIRDNEGMEGFPGANVHKQFAEVHDNDELTIPPSDHPETETSPAIESESVHSQCEPKEDKKTFPVNTHHHQIEDGNQEISLSSTNGHSSNSVHELTELTRTNPEPSAEIDALSPETLNGGTLVPTSPEQSEIECEQDQEIQVDTKPLEDIKEQQYQSVHIAAQYNAATNLAAFNYLTLDYMKHRDFTIDGLAQQVQQSEQAVRESFASMMESPEQATKKLLAKIRRRRKRT